MKAGAYLRNEGRLKLLVEQLIPGEIPQPRVILDLLRSFEAKPAEIFPLQTLWASVVVGVCVCESMDARI